MVKTSAELNFEFKIHNFRRILASAFNVAKELLERFSHSCSHLKKSRQKFYAEEN